MTIVIHSTLTGDHLVIGPFENEDDANRWIEQRKAQGIPGVWLIDRLTSPSDGWNQAAGEARRTEIVEDRECDHKWRDYSEFGGDFKSGELTCKYCGETKVEPHLETQIIGMISGSPEDVDPGVESDHDSIGGKWIENPKDEGYHSLHADLWDQREGK